MAQRPLNMDSLNIDDFEDYDWDNRSSVSRTPTAFQGLRVIMLITNTPVNKQACALAKQFLAGKCTEIILTHVAPNAYSYEGMQGVLEALAEGLSGFKVRTELVEKREDQTLVEAIVEFTMLNHPDLVILGSTSLCNDARMEEAASKAKRNSHAGHQALGTSVHATKPSRQAFGMKLCQALRTVPLLVVKANSRGSFFSYTGTTNIPLKFMIDLQPTSRHMMAWLMHLMEAGKDSLYLAVGKAYDAIGITKQVATRMITAFSVQASVNKFKAERRLFKDASEKALPQAVYEDEIDILMVQAPRSKDLSPYIITLLCSVATSILVWPPEADSNALGQKAVPKDDGGERPSSAMGGARVSRNPSMGHENASTGTGSAALSPRPSSRQSPYTGSGSGGYTYSYNAPQVGMDDATKAAMDAMAGRMQRRKEADEKAQAALSASQRGRAGAFNG